MTKKAIILGLTLTALLAVKSVNADEKTAGYYNYGDGCI